MIAEVYHSIGKKNAPPIFEATLVGTEDIYPIDDFVDSRGYKPFVLGYGEVIQIFIGEQLGEVDPDSGRANVEVRHEIAVVPPRQKIAIVLATSRESVLRLHVHNLGDASVQPKLN
jgi:hypothetical protein